VIRHRGVNGVRNERKAGPFMEGVGVINNIQTAYVVEVRIHPGDGLFVLKGRFVVKDGGTEFAVVIAIAR